MKLSNALLVSIITSSIGLSCQTDEDEKINSTPKDNIEINPSVLSEDTIAVGEKITPITSKEEEFSHEYCPPCGMG